MPLRRAFGRVLHDMRVRRGLTLGEFAAIIAVPEATVREWEAGAEVPAPDAMEAVAALFRSRTLARPSDRADAPRTDQPNEHPAPPDGGPPDA
jgi:transcriptional regulator with XRE-family HTH domain